MQYSANILPPLYPIVNLNSKEAPLPFVSTLFKCGIALIQLRAKSLSEEETISAARSVLTLRDELSKNSLLHPKVIINDNPAVCLAARADGVHLGAQDMPPEKARELLGPEAIIGFSTHSAEEVRRAPTEALNYLGIGPVFLSPTKSGHAPELGLGELRAAVKQTTLPATAIGGISSENVEDVYRSGIKSAAVISDLAKAKDLPAKISKYFQIFETVFS